MLLNIIVNSKKKTSHADAVTGNEEEEKNISQIKKKNQISWVFILCIISKF